MANPSRLPQYMVRNDGAGPYAIFYCEKCRREFRTQPPPPDTSQIKELGENTIGNLLRHIPVVGESVATSVVDVVANSVAQSAQTGTEAVSNLLQNIPVVGNVVAAGVTATDPRRAQALTPQQLNTAWLQVQSAFRECPTCNQIVCIADYDEASGFCNEHKPGGAAAPAPAAAPPAYGGSPYDTPAPAYGSSPYDTPATPPAPSAAAEIRCAKCGTATQGAKFCPNCGTKVEAPAPAPTHCPNCGTETKGAKFCANCGTKLS